MTRGRALGRALGVEPREAAGVAWSFALFFCVLASWYVLRPLRDAMGIAGSTDDLPHLFLVTLALTLAASPALSALVSRLPRGRFLRLASRFLAAALLVFAVLLRGARPSPVAARAFFVWASVSNLLALTLAWALVSDVFTRAQGVRLFALIGAGGTLGATLGALATSLVVGRIGPAGMLLLAAALIEGAVRCTDRVAASARPEAQERGASPGGGALGWMRHAVTSPFLLALSGYLVLFTFTSTVLYFEQARIVKASLPDTALRAQLFARIDFAANALTLVLQIGVAGRALRALGVGGALALLPLVTLGCFAAIRLAPVLGVLIACQVGRRALDFALTRPAREVLFTVVEPEHRYKAKSFIDTFVYRSGDALAVVSFEGVGGSALALGMGLTCAAWAVLGFALGRARSG